MDLDPSISNRSDVLGRFGTDTWQRKLFTEFDALLTSPTRPFPCVFGATAHGRGQLRYAFVERLTKDAVGPPLRRFVRESRSYGPLTSLVVFEAPTSLQCVRSYHTRFWNLLSGLVECDVDRWPESVPARTDDPRWEFCFAGEPIFVVCNTPAHLARQSRRLSSMTMTFQPRWVFDGVLGNETTARKATATVRARLRPYDFVAPAPSLGLYGDPDNREADQYFLSDDESVLGCPFERLGRAR